MKKKVIFVSIAVLVVACVITLYFVAPSVNYSLQPRIYQKIDDHWCTVTDYYNQSRPRINGTFTTVECKKNGLFDATFNIIVKLTGNATFSQSDFLPTAFVDAHTIKLSYTLRSQERTNTDLYFAIGNPPRFDISIEFQSKQFLLRQTESNWGGQSEFRYGRAYLNENNTVLVPPMIS
jgi:hypothetical protein